MNLDQYLFNISSVYKKSIITDSFDWEIPSLNQEIITQLENKIGLRFLLEKDPEGNVCMANNKEVRSEFRQNFSPIDILDYCFALLNSSNFRSENKKLTETNFQYPNDSQSFWKLVALGSELKEIHSQKIKDNNSLSKIERLILKIDEIKL